MHRWAVFCDERVTEGDLAPEIRVGGSSPRSRRPSPASTRDSAVRPLAEVVREVERVAIDQALAVHGGNLSRAAAALGIERNTLKRKLRGR